MNSAQTNIMPHPYSDFTYSIGVESWPLLLFSGALVLTLLALLIRKIRVS